jgi:hypothetical protein
MADEPGTNPRKPFVPPSLAVFGDLATVTQTIGMEGPLDGGKGTAKGTTI